MPLVKKLCDGCIKAIVKENRCVAYAFPENWNRLGDCPLKSNKVLNIVKGKKLNPIKASRRRTRGR